MRELQNLVVTRAAFVTALAAVAVVSCAAVVATGAPDGRAQPAEGAPVFAARLVRLIAANRYARAWQTLHPRHQVAAARDEYVACERETPVPGTVVSIHVLRSSDATFAAAGAGSMSGKAVRLQVLIAGAAMPEGVAVVDTVHLVRLEGRWRWFLPSERYELYRRDACARPPSNGPLGSSSNPN